MEAQRRDDKRAALTRLLGEPEGLRGLLQRATKQAGPERDTVLIVFKGCVAGVLSWALAEYVIASPQSVYAPFTALLVIQSTAYRSLLHSVRYIIAVILGVLAAGAAGPLVGQNAGAFALMLACTLVIGRWQRLGMQGLQVSVVGIFAYNALAGTHISALWEIVAMALLGAGVGLCVSLLLLPPLRYRTAEQGVSQMSQAVCTLLRDIAEGLREGPPERDTVADWLYRARQLDTAITSARHAVDTGAESVVYNPRRLLRRSTPTTFVGYRALIDALARASEQVRSMCYGLLRVTEDPGSGVLYDDFLRPYAELIDVLAQAAGEIGALDDDDRNNPLHRILEDGRARHRDPTSAVDGQAAWPSHGVLLTDADRMLEEFAHAHSKGATQP